MKNIFKNTIGQINDRWFKMIEKKFKNSEYFNGKDLLMNSEPIISFISPYNHETQTDDDPIEIIDKSVLFEINFQAFCLRNKRYYKCLEELLYSRFGTLPIELEEQLIRPEDIDDFIIECLNKLKLKAKNLSPGNFINFKIEAFDYLNDELDQIAQIEEFKLKPLIIDRFSELFEIKFEDEIFTEQFTQISPTLDLTIRVGELADLLQILFESKILDSDEIQKNKIIAFISRYFRIRSNERERYKNIDFENFRKEIVRRRNPKTDKISLDKLMNRLNKSYNSLIL